MRRRLAGPLCCLLAAFAGAAPVQAQAPADARTAAFPPLRGFLDEGPGSMTLVGTAVRFRNAIPFYTLAYYVNLAELQAALGPGARTLTKMGRVLSQGKISQGYVTRFEQGVSKDRRVEFLMENLQLYWDGPEFSPDTPTLRAFLPFFDVALERGEETQVWIRNGSIYTRKPGAKPTRTADAALCRAFANSYLGDLRKPGADRIMRNDLLSGLPAALEDAARRRRPSPR